MISPSQLLLDEIQLAFDEIRRRFDEFDARMERRFSWTQAALEQRGAAGKLRIGGLEQFGATQHVMADNWGGLFEPVPVLEECVYEPAATDTPSPPPVKEHQDAMVVLDNWGGHFEQLAHMLEGGVCASDWLTDEPVATEAADGAYTSLALSAIDANVGFAGLASKDQIRGEGAVNSPDLDAPACLTPTPIVSTTAAAVPVEISPMDFKRQTQALEKPPSSSSRATAAEEEMLRAILFGGYVGSFRLEFAQSVEKKQVAQPEAERSGFLAARVKQERLIAIVRAELLGACDRVFVGVDLESHSFSLCNSVQKAQFLVANTAAAGDSELHAVAVSNIFTTQPSPLRCVRLTCCYMDEHWANPRFRLVNDEYALHAVPLGGYDGSLDDDPASGFAHLDAPLDRAIGRVGQALAAAAALRADVVGLAGGGLLAWVVAAGSAQTNCSIVCSNGGTGVLVSLPTAAPATSSTTTTLATAPATLNEVATHVLPAAEFHDIPKHDKPKSVAMVTIARQPSST
ncbi:uncharacterized protein [Miscanthus floridulus]|uniref:uncharacterized protein n=1 Tax=Miscanthus floridulus TaxID=154761 RepID=UPI00345A9267